VRRRRLILAWCYLAALLAAQLPHGHVDPREAALLAAGGAGTGGTGSLEPAGARDAGHGSTFCAACHFRVTLVFCPESGPPSPSLVARPLLDLPAAAVATGSPRLLSNRGPPSA
jgi:hypothetical protein